MVEATSTCRQGLRPIMIVPDFDRVGGYERQAFFMARAHVRAGIPVILLTNNPWNHPPHETREGVSIQRLPFAPAHRQSWINAFKSFLIFLHSHRHEYDVIHVHAFTFLGAICSLIGWVLGKPVLIKVATEQDIREFHYGKQLGFRVFYPMIRRARRFLALSEAIREEFLACGFPPKRVVLMPNGVDDEHFHPRLRSGRAARRTELGLDAERVHFLFTGRLVQRKGVDLIVDAFAQQPRLRDARVVVLGDGDQREALEERARQAGVADCFRFVGEHPEVRPYLAACDVFVFPSRLEGLPNALLEAMSSGLPAIATRIGGCTDVVTEGAGILVEPDDADALAAAMLEVLEDPALRERLTDGARRRIEERFAFPRILEDLQREYATLVGSGVRAADFQA